MSKAEDILAHHLNALKIPYEREHLFHPKRRWRFDFAFPDVKLAVEIEGGVWMKKSRHTSPRGFMGDIEKYNEATNLGWRLLRFTPEQVKKGMAINAIEGLLNN